MKTIAKIVIALALVLTIVSCSNDEQCCPPQSGQWETVTCDTEDNLIKIGDQWLTNSNWDYNNWQYLQTIGWKLDAPHFTIVVTDGRKILDASLFNFTYDLVINRPNDHTVIFYSTHMVDYIDNTSIFYVNLKLSE